MSDALPAGWNYESLTEFCDLVTDGTHDTPKRQKSGIRLLTSKNLKDGKFKIDDSYFICHEDFLEIEKRSRVDIGDVIYGMIGTIGNPAIIYSLNPPFAVKNVAIFKFSGDFTRAKWLTYYLNSDDFIKHIEQSQTGNAQRFVGLGFLRTTSIPVPPYPEQRQIASILTSVDEVIGKTEAQISKLQDLKKGMMQELLTKGIDHTEFKDSPVGRIPKEWEVSSLEAICTRVGVGIASSTTHAYTKKGVPILRNQNIHEGELDTSDLLHITKQFSDENDSKKIKEGDVLTIRTGYPGISAVVPPEFHNCHSFTTLVSTPNNDVLDSDYLALWINSDYGKTFVLGGQAGGAQQNLNVSILKQLPVLVPKLDEQKAISGKLIGFHRHIRLIENKLNYYKNIKNALMQDLLTGKVRVKTD